MFALLVLMLVSVFMSVCSGFYSLGIDVGEMIVDICACDTFVVVHLCSSS